jgi:hypothetical protein
MLCEWLMMRQIPQIHDYPQIQNTGLKNEKMGYYRKMARLLM